MAERDGVLAVLVALSDVSTVRGVTVDLLGDAYRAGVGDALATDHDGDHGNPVLYDRPVLRRVHRNRERRRRATGSALGRADALVEVTVPS